MTTIHSMMEQILSNRDVSKPHFTNFKIDEVLTALSDVDVRDLAVRPFFLVICLIVEINRKAPAVPSSREL